MRVSRRSSTRSTRFCRGPEGRRIARVCPLIILYSSRVALAKWDKSFSLQYLNLRNIPISISANLPIRTDYSVTRHFWIHIFIQNVSDRSIRLRLPYSFCHFFICQNFSSRNFPHHIIDLFLENHRWPYGESNSASSLEKAVS